MSHGEGTLVVLGCVTLGLLLRWVWKKIPCYQCQRCYSYEVTINPEGFAVCEECGLTWDPNEKP